MKLFIRSFIPIVVALLVTGCATVPTETSEATKAGAKRWGHIVDTAFVAEHAVIPIRKDVVIVDARPPRMYDKGHIPTAINILDTKFKEMSYQLPEDKKMSVIFYCGGQKCFKSHKAAFMAEALGYTNITVYADGMPVWSKSGNFASVSTAYIKKLVAKPGKTVIIDTRPGRKFKKGAVPGAINIPATRFDLAKLPEEKKTPLIFYCGGFKCKLSLKAATKAKAAGYTNVKLYQAGYPAWKAAQ